MTQIIQYKKQTDLYELVERDGYFVLPDFYNPEVIASLRERLGRLLDADEAKRDANRQPMCINENGVRSDYTNDMHNLLFPSFLDPLFADTVTATLELPIVQSMLERVVGKGYRMRADLVRRSTGMDDSVDIIQLPHNWHRDSPGEFTFGFFLDDCSAPDSGGTAVVPGTHWSRHDPLYDFMLGPRSYTSAAEQARGNWDPIPEEMRLTGKHNLELRERIGKSAVEMRGKPGDMFFFLNDLFHGRWPNRTGKRLMLVRYGGFSSAFPFKADLCTPQVFHDNGEKVARLFGSQRQIPKSQDILLCHIRDHVRLDPLEEAAAEEKQKVVAQFLEERSRPKPVEPAPPVVPAEPVAASEPAPEPVPAAPAPAAEAAVSPAVAAQANQRSLLSRVRRAIGA